MDILDTPKSSLRRNALSCAANQQRRRSTIVILSCAAMVFVTVCVLIAVLSLTSGASVNAPPPDPIAAGIPPAGSSHLDASDGRILKLVHTVFRHGPRTPADTYPNDPYVNETFYPYGWGHLTNEGKQFMFETGQWLNERYGSFLGKYYEPDAIWAQTTGVPRTQMSMALVLAGLLPPKGTAMEWNPVLNWQPVPIYSQPLDEDTLLLVRTPCPRYYEALDEVFATADLQTILAENAQLFAELTEHTGMRIATPDDVQSLYSTLRAEQEFGLRLPAWTDAYFPDRLQPLTELSYEYNVYTDEMKKFKAGPFIGKMLREWQQRSAGALSPNGRKMFLYTGHDSTIVNVLAALDVWQRQLPVYGIMAIFELLEDEQTHEWGVQIYLRNSKTSGAVPLTIPGCEHFCPLNTFARLAEKLHMRDAIKECAAINKDFTTPPPSGP